MIANNVTMNTETEIEVGEVKALNEEPDEDGLVWWNAEEREDIAEEEEEPIERNPFRRWADVDQEELDEGLGQGGIRPDPQNGDGSFGVFEGSEIRREESRKPKKNTKVHTPTREEIEDHEKHHCPFRAWCRHCVKGRGVNAQHRRKT